MTSLVAALNSLLWLAKDTFPQHRTFLRARELAFGFVITWGRRTVSRAICALNHQFQDWSASYRLFSRSPWDPADLFQPVLTTAVAMVDSADPIPIAVDDTTLRKTSKRIPGVSYARDPKSPKFHPNLIMGQRFIHAAIIVRPEGLQGPARTIPIRFQPAPPPTKPDKKAGEEEWAAYRQAKKTQNLSHQAVSLFKEIRTSLDQAGHANRAALLVADGSYCNGTVLRNRPEKTEVIARTRDDITLYKPPTPEQLVGRGRRRKYGDPLPKPKEIRQDDEIPWREADIWGAGRIHKLKYKLIPNVLWRSGSRATPLQLVIIAPLGYRKTTRSKKLYRKPAYLLTTDLTTPVEKLIQAYFDRWEIEVNHRDQKSMFGVGEAQVWSEPAALRLPQFLVAVYAMLLLASLLSYGAKRTDHYEKQPAWRSQPSLRPSISDILARIREEFIGTGAAAVPVTGGIPAGGRRPA